MVNDEQTTFVEQVRAIMRGRARTRTRTDRVRARPGYRRPARDEEMCSGRRAEWRRSQVLARPWCENLSFAVAVLYRYRAFSKIRSGANLKASSFPNAESSS